MPAFTDPVVAAGLLGIGATLVADAWALFQRKVLRWHTFDYSLLGRLIGELTRGRVAHADIRTASRFPGETAIGWIAHYAIGIAFAALLLSIVGRQWMEAPSIAPALAVGLGTVVAPFFVLQPWMGLGVAASRTPNPAQARLRSVATHAVFGVGLYLSALLISRIG